MHQGRTVERTGKIVLLKTDRVLEGTPVEVGDFIYLKQPNGEIEIPKSQIEAIFNTFAETYHYQLQHINLNDQQEQLDLFSWCLQYNQLSLAQQHLLVLQRMQCPPDIMKRLELQIQQEIQVQNQQILNDQNKSQMTGNQATATESLPLALQMELALENLPQAEKDEFFQRVQPILFTNCAQSGCHGSASQNDYHLIRPTPNSRPTYKQQRYNLFNTLKFLKSEDNKEPPFLQKAASAHGPMDQPAFASQGLKKQHELLQSFGQKILAHQATLEKREAQEDQGSDKIEEDHIDQKDEFDPKIFNDRYHSKRRNPLERLLMKRR
ncbi:MAG: hypothetical protein MPJ24_01385 [Pirellulaceae bacterium]|nr:hypothetical protein [Pirellulaceae bacterium]